MGVVHQRIALDATLTESAHGKPLLAAPTATDQELTLSALFEWQADRIPDECAVTAGNTALTYRQLDQAANFVALELAERRVTRSQAVLCAFTRSCAALVAQLAVYKAGAVYVPIDPDAPASRLQLLAKRTQAAAVLTTPARIQALTGLAALVLSVDASERLVERPASRPAAADTAYIIFTSGSTGEPKGVMVDHRAIVSTTLARLRYFEEPVRRFLMIWPLTFDAALGETWLTLAEGGTLDFAPTSLDGVMTAVDAVLNGRTQTSHISLTPSHYLGALKRLRTPAAGPVVTLVAGEPCPPGLIAEHFRYQPTTRLHNGYGPTEAAVGCCIAELLPGEDVTVGRAIHGAKILVLDAEGHDASAGEVGEVYISGTGLAQGYVNDPELTAERFLDHPDGRRYRTGDFGRLLPDGRLVILGRTDDQLKIRGHRIEPGEIEVVLQAHPEVAQAVVAESQGRLVAYVIRRDDVDRPSE